MNSLINQEKTKSTSYENIDVDKTYLYESNFQV